MWYSFYITHNFFVGRQNNESGKQMKHRVTDPKYHFITLFDDRTGTYIRSGVIENGRDTGADPFMASFPHLNDVGVMGHCIHGKTGLCRKAGIGCYQSGALVEKPNMTVDDGVMPGRLPSHAGNRILRQRT